MQTVIIGGGYAGLTAALRLARMSLPGRIILVNDRPEHQLTTQLHKVAADATPPRMVLLSLERLLQGTGVELILGRVRTLEPKNKRICFTDGKELTYDRLVVALGSDVETFGVPGVMEHAFHVQPLHEAMRLRHHVTSWLVDTEADPTLSRRIVIVGGGLTGVELAGELADTLAERWATSREGSNPVHVHLMEAGPRLLPGLAPFLGNESARVLARKGVDVTTKTTVEVITPDGVITEGTLLPADAVVWTAGVRANRLTEIAFSSGPRGRARVDEYLRAVDYPDVYILGDNAAAVSKGAEHPAAPTAQNAVQQAIVVADNIAREIRSEKLIPYVAKPLGLFVSVGQAEAVGELVFGDFWHPRLTGFSAYAMKWASEQRYKLSIGAVGPASTPRDGEG